MTKNVLPIPWAVQWPALLLLLICSLAVVAQTQTQEITQQTVPSSPPLRVLNVYNLDFKNRGLNDPNRNSAGIGDYVVLEVEGLPGLQERADCKEKDRPSTCVKQNIALFLNDRPVAGLSPEWWTDRELCYHLQRTAQSDEQWADLLGFSINGAETGLSRPVKISVGLEHENAINPYNGTFALIRVRKQRLLAWSVLIAGILFLLIREAIRTDLLRDRNPVEWGKRRPYSLSLCQAAWWFALVFVSFTFIYLVTGQFDISPQALILLGIGLGTAVGASMIDQGKQETDVNKQPNNAKLQNLLGEKERLEAELGDLQSRQRGLSGDQKKSLDDALTAKRAECKAQIQEINNEFPDALRPGSEGFRKDILTDANGVSFHRFQMAAWTFILGIIFVQQVLSRLAMPRFSETILALMGISAGAFLGLKTTESHNAPAGKPPTGGEGKGKKEGEGKGKELAAAPPPAKTELVAGAGSPVDDATALASTPGGGGLGQK